jgi:two-component system sensor histidine kinase BaeS
MPGTVSHTFHMKVGITSKMVLVLLATSVLLVGAMAVAMSWSFQKGFRDYLTEAELGRLDQTTEDLANAYRREGSWDFIRGRHRVWASFLPLNDQGLPLMPEVTSQTASTPPFDKFDNQNVTPQGVTTPDSVESRLPIGGQLGIQAPPLPPSDRSGLSTRLRLLDARKRNLIGPPDTTGNVVLRPIELDNELVGWLSLTPLPVPSSGLDRSFRDEQLNAIYPIAAGALLLALLIGIPIGRHLLKPTKDVARGAHILAQGRFDIRLKPRSSDELGQLALDFNALAEALQRNELLRRQGMADISHELRTPLALLRGEIEAMQDGVRPMDESGLGKLHDSIMQLSRLVDDLYDLTLTDAGALNYRKEQLNLAAVLHHSADMAEHRLAQSRLNLIREIPEQLTLFGDPRRLRQVADNLLKNSRRYTDPGGKIRLCAWQTKGNIHFKIEDSPPGVDEELLPHLFDRFYRTESSRNRAAGGAGLGLAICRNIVEAHQGEIRAEPSPLGGLQIVVSLPSG